MSCQVTIDRLTGFVKFRLLEDSKGETVADEVGKYPIWELQARVKEIWTDQGAQFAKGPHFHAIFMLHGNEVKTRRWVLYGLSQAIQNPSRMVRPPDHSCEAYTCELTL